MRICSFVAKKIGRILVKNVNYFFKNAKKCEKSNVRAFLGLGAGPKFFRPSLGLGRAFF